MKAREVKRLRESMGLTQQQFAIKYKMSVKTLRSWEQRGAVSVLSNAFLRLVKRR